MLIRPRVFFFCLFVRFAPQSFFPLFVAHLMYLPLVFNRARLKTGAIAHFRTGPLRLWFICTPPAVGRGLRRSRATRGCVQPNAILLCFRLLFLRDKKCPFPAVSYLFFVSIFDYLNKNNSAASKIFALIACLDGYMRLLPLSAMLLCFRFLFLWNKKCWFPTVFHLSFFFFAIVLFKQEQ